MPNDYANKANINGTDYDLHDMRVPEVTASDADKVLKVNSQGGLEFGEAGGGGGTSVSVVELVSAGPHLQNLTQEEIESLVNSPVSLVTLNGAYAYKMNNNPSYSGNTLQFVNINSSFNCTIFTISKSDGSITTQTKQLAQ